MRCLCSSFLNIVAASLAILVTYQCAAVFLLLKPNDEVPATWPLTKPDGRLSSDFVFPLDEIADWVGNILVEQSTMWKVVFEIAIRSEISLVLLFRTESWVAALTYDVFHMFG
ncbi:MAG: hypothetical protein ACRD40_12195 [Candidatus Acidiferrales bacterium]